MECALTKGRDVPAPRLLPRLGARRWLGLLPFLLFALAFMILPCGSILMGSFQDASGHLTLANFAHLGRPTILRAYWVTIEVSAASALGGTLLGFLLAYAITLGGLPKEVRAIVLTFSGVASNFAGVPLAFAFIATLGRMGMVTFVLKSLFHLDLYEAGFNLYSFWGLCLTYLYFQLPLMVLILTPALDGIRREWREASESLGATRFQYWRLVALPILMPSLLSSAILLFGNAFGAYATAYALTGGLLNLVPILIGAQIQGDVLHDPNLGYALALGMVAVMVLCIVACRLLQKRSSRWLA